LKLFAGLLLGSWLLLILLGKGGFAHIPLLVGIAFAVIEIGCIYRSKITK
jgi:hypothetical protein